MLTFPYSKELTWELPFWEEGPSTFKGKSSILTGELKQAEADTSLPSLSLCSCLCRRGQAIDNCVLVHFKWGGKKKHSLLEHWSPLLGFHFSPKAFK